MLRALLPCEHTFHAVSVSRGREELRFTLGNSRETQFIRRLTILEECALPSL